MRNGKTFEEINKVLINMQEIWYKQLLKTHFEFKDYAKFSSPFCFGISKYAWNEHRPLIMYIGEEPNDWCFNDENHNKQNIGRLQEYSITYLEKQLYATLDTEKYQCVKQNTSPFWSFIRDIYKENNTVKYNICWNNLDKLHQIVESKTRPLTYNMEEKLHNILILEKSLLLNEIELVRPDIIIFMGKYYDKSMAWAMGHNYVVSELDKYIPSPETCFVSEVKEIPYPIQTKIKKMIWIYHPNYIQHQGAESYSAAKMKIQEILNSIEQ